jgi:hypothetical protein
MNKSLPDLISHARQVSRAQERTADVSSEEARPGFIDRVLSARESLAEPTVWMFDCEKQLRWALALCVVITVGVLMPMKQPAPPIEQVAAPWLEMEGSRNLHWGDL